MTVIATALLVQPSGLILLHLRDNNPAILFSNQWSLIGGHAESGETPEQTLIREVQEEIGYQVNQQTLLATFYDGDAARHVFVVPIDAPVSELVLTEGQAIKYVDPRKALDEPRLAVTGRRFIEAYLRHLEFMTYLRRRQESVRLPEE